MKDKKTEWQRVGIFLLISFGIAWIQWITFNKIYGFSEWFNGTKVFIIASLAVFSPAISNVLTRLITKEGVSGSLLHLRIRKGGLKYYLIAMVVPILSGLVSGLIFSLVFGCFDTEKISETYSLPGVIGIILNVIAVGSLYAFVTFGEEFGWRAYLIPKLENLLGTVGAVVVGGIIWGVWHAPLTVEGHNYGTEYWGYPYMGIVLMSVFCTAEGIFLMWLVRKTGSVYPAAIAHGIINSGASGIGQIFITDDIEKFQNVQHHFIFSSGSLLIGLIFLVMMLKDDRKKKISE